MVGIAQNEVSNQTTCSASTRTEDVVIKPHGSASSAFVRYAE